MTRGLFILAGFLCLLSLPAAAQVPREMVEAVAKKAHENIAKAKISDGSLIGPEKAKTLKYPLVPFEEIEQTVLRGYVSGIASVCGIDWKNRSFIPYMAIIRSKHKDWNDYQFAYVGLVHGIAMGSAERDKPKEGCPDELKKKLESKLAPAKK